ncbi:WAP four-disulfide core domain protein 1-like isoform X2 [Macrosteles quadrilineatus]|nr:WAP four-disulfide core domain protein 1-like isoform X2 [Macrosteles quadrilineatus]
MDDNVEDAVREEVDGLSMGEDHKMVVPWSSLCPPPVSPLQHSACNAIPCSGNIDCHSRHNHTYLCCFNGCMDTCMRALDPPPVFDWIEDLPEKRTLIVPGQVVSHSSPPESVALPGGCVITPLQFLSLEHFKQNQHVSDCFCDIGGVFCKIVQ